VNGLLLLFTLYTTGIFALFTASEIDAKFIEYINILQFSKGHRMPVTINGQTYYRTLEVCRVAEITAVNYFFAG
jgi:hypothetical protein